MLKSRLCLCLLLLSMTPGKTQDLPIPMKRFVLTEDFAYGVLPSDLIAGPTVQQLQFSPDSRYLLLVQKQTRINSDMFVDMASAQNTGDIQPPGKLSLIFWDAATRRAHEVWKTNDLSTTIQSINWLPKSDVALVLINEFIHPNPAMTGLGEQRQKLLRVEGNSDQATPVSVPNVDDESQNELFVAPDRALAVLIRTRFAHANVPQTDGSTATKVESINNVYLLRGNSRAPVECDFPSKTTAQDVTWSPDGTPVVTGVYITKVDGKNRGVTQYYALNPQNGMSALVEKKPIVEAVRITPPIIQNGLSLRKTLNAIQDVSPANVNLLWLDSSVKSDKSHVLICSDADEGFLLPKCNAIVYTSQGAAFASPILKLEKSRYLALNRIVQRKIVVNNAKQIGLGLLMYAQDYDAVLPDMDAGKGVISPYLKGSDLLSGFTYTYDGGPIEDIEEPANTELGYVAGDGGRAIIYADGHVIWKPNKQS